MHNVEIIPISQYRRISLHCPNCSRYSLMDISRKVRVKGKVKYQVRCRHCKHEFLGGRRACPIREIGQRYGLTRKEVKSLKLFLFAGDMRGLISGWERDDPDPQEILNRFPGINYELDVMSQRFEQALNDMKSQRKGISKEFPKEVK